MSRNRFLILEIILPLLVACLLYLLFRPVDTVIFKITTCFGLESVLLFFRSLIDQSLIPSWIIYSLPGGLWLFAFQNTISLLKNFSYKEVIIPIISALGIGVGLEVFQYFNITDGRFDWMDVLIYSISTITSLTTIFLINNKWEFYTEEKASMKLSGFIYLFFVVIIYLADII